MGNVKIEVLVEQVLTAMVSDDMSKHTIKLYKVRGYNRIDPSPILQTHKTSSIIKEKDVSRNG